MSTPSIVSTSRGRYIEAKQGTPVATVTANAATWRGSSMAPQRSFPLLANQSFVARGNGRFNVIDPKIGPRVGSSRGTFDCWFKMGSGADSVVIAQSVYSTTATPLITLGVNAAGQAVGDIDNAAGTTVAAWAATTMASVAQGGLIHMQVAWDATTPISGLYHVTVVVNGVAMPPASFTTPPLAAWTPFQPIYVTTGVVTETGFDGEMILTQASTRVVL